MAVDAEFGFEAGGEEVGFAGGLLLAEAGLLLAGAGLLLAGAGLLLVGAGLLLGELVGDGEVEVGAGLGGEGRGCGWLLEWLGAVTSCGGCTG